MQIVVKKGTVFATHPDSQDVAGLYPGCLVLTVPDGTVVEIGQAWEVDLEAAKAAACADIDAEAERRRNLVLTPGSGQMAAYQAKEAQAAALLQDQLPTEEKYPDIYNEVGITADSAGEVAMIVLAAAEAWRVYGRALERVRLAGKKAANAAAGVAGAVAARDGVAWP